MRWVLTEARRHGGTEKDSQLAMDDSSDAILHLGVNEIQ